MSSRQHAGGEGGGYWWKVADFKSLQKINSLRLEENLNTLSPQHLFHIYRHLDLTSLGNLSLTARTFSYSIVKYLLEEAKLKQVLYSFTQFKGNVASTSQAQLYLAKANKVEFNIQGDISVFKYYQLTSPVDGRKNFKELGIMLKRVTMLKSTKDRMQIMLQIVNKFMLIPQQSNKEICEMFALFLHMFVLGWFEGECLYALNTFVRAPVTQSYAIRENGLELNIGTVMDEVVRITADDYTFGVFAPYGDCSCISKLLLVATAPFKKSECANLQWQDSVEAVPACVRVATFRYDALVKSVLALSRMPKYREMIVRVIMFIFIEPDQWLPENKASFLLLAGPQITKVYLMFVVDQNLLYVTQNGKQIEETTFRSVGDIFMGLFMMQSRFKRSLEPVFTRLDELLCHIPQSANQFLLKAVWKALTRELSDVIGLEDEEDDQLSKDSRQHLKSILTRLGKLYFSKIHNIYSSLRIIDSFPRILKLNLEDLNSFVSPEGPKAWVNKTGVRITIKAFGKKNDSCPNHRYSHEMDTEE